MSYRPTMRKTRNQLANMGVQNENMLRPKPSQPKKNIGVKTVKLITKDSTKNTLGLRKRKSEVENSEDLIVPKKRAAFGDITNAIEKSLNKPKKGEVTKGVKRHFSTLNVLKKSKSTTALHSRTLAVTKPRVVVKNKENSIPNANAKKISSRTEDTKTNNKDESINNSLIILSQELKISTINLEDSVSYITASEGSPMINCASTSKKTELPPGVEDFDENSAGDVFAVSEYVMEIFKNYKEREARFPVEKYISRQPDVTRTMRSILIDWMVEVQESFELNHETLYLAVKLVDLYLSKVVISRDKLQLIGSTAIFIACKFDERTPPYIDDFLYICDDAYKRKELIMLEIQMLKTLNFDLGIPLSYRFLRRYARCGKVSLETLTFARYILELTLMDYEFIEATDSVLACAALFLALYIKENIKEWSLTLQYFSGYTLEDFYHFIKQLHQMLLQPPKDHLKTVRAKYTHKLFFEVAKIPIPEHVLD